MQTVLITGAGSGIGAATARRMASSGKWRVLLMGRRTAPLESIAKESDALIALPCDVTDRSALQRALEGPVADLVRHPLTSVFANAGIGGPNTFGTAGEGDRWDEIIETNLTGVYNTVMTALPHLRQSRIADHALCHVVVTSSVLARFGVPGQSAYVASKTALLGLVRSWAAEWSSEGILVNAICPGWVETEMAQASMLALGKADGLDYEQSKTVQASLLPTKRISDPSEVAALVYWLTSGEQRSIVGQSLDINNGSSMQ